MADTQVCSIRLKTETVQALRFLAHIKSIRDGLEVRWTHLVTKAVEDFVGELKPPLTEKNIV